MEPPFAAFRIPKLLSMELGRNKSSVRHSAATEDNSFFRPSCRFRPKNRKTEKPPLMKNSYFIFFRKMLFKISVVFGSVRCEPEKKKSSFESFRSGTSSGLKLGAGFSVVVMIRLGALELRFCFAAGSKLELKLLMA